jgi:hypothetical protein
MSLYHRVAGSQLGSSALFGGAFFASTVSTDGVAEATFVGMMAAGAWFASLPLLKLIVGATARA